ncbi:class I adenylate-forming enzyme family protein [Kitasatospora sp. NPDC056327]|uniref:class I adenylate-forming enzyme family protein n=1 Tax=Kitasatospora sp. NPDC056327 TaxID=3345785 RepID=UPI0035DA1223
MTAPGTPWTPALLHDILDRAAELWPDRPALSQGELTLDYREFAAASRRLAELLRTAGVRRGDRVVAAAPSGPALAVLVFAVSRLGAAYTLLHEQVHGAPLLHVLDDCEPRLLITEDPADREAADGRSIAALPLSALVGAAFPPAGADAPGAEPPGAAPGERAAGAGPGAPARPAGPADGASGVLAVDPVSLIYTSGTTALPKAVVSTHQQVLFAARAIQSVLGYRADDVVYCPLPLSFDYGLYQVHLSVLSGAHLWLGLPSEAGPMLLRRLAATGATVLPGVPSASEGLAWLLRRSANRLPALRLLTNTGAALSAETIAGLRAALPDLRVQVMYGLTECKRATIMPPDGDLARPGSCGLPLPGTQVLAVDDDGAPVPPGEIGQLVVRGPHVMAGYWRRPELNAERFPRRDGLFPELWTGDYGWLDEDGYVYFSGRRDDLYKENGFRLSATEVEAAAHRVPGVVSAAVLPPEGRRPSVLVVVGRVEAAEALELMREQIEVYKIPRRCVVLDALPLSANGKVDRRRLAARLAEIVV